MKSSTSELGLTLWCYVLVVAKGLAGLACVTAASPRKKNRRRDDVSPPIFFRAESAVAQAKQCGRDRWKDLKRLKYHIVRTSLQYKRLSGGFEMTGGLLVLASFL